MPQFIYLDPIEYDSVLAIARHEAAHGVLAYYYGFSINYFRTMPFDAGWTGAVSVDAGNINGNINLMMARVRQLVAGELAERLYLDMDPDVLTLPIEGGHVVGPGMPLNQVWHLLIKEPPRDMVKVIRIIRDIAPQNWWQWLWDRHAETKVLINAYNRQISQLAQHLLYPLRNPYSNIDVGIWNWLTVHCLRRRNAEGPGSFVQGRYLTRCIMRSGMQTAV